MTVPAAATGTVSRDGKGAGMRVATWQITDEENGHYKYYRAFVGDTTVMFQYGRIGAIGQVVVDTRSVPFAAAKMALNRIASKLNDNRKNYRPDGGVYSADVDPGVWSAGLSARLGVQLHAAYTQARERRIGWGDSLRDGEPHVVGYATARRCTLPVPAAASATNKAGTLSIAVVNAADALLLGQSATIDSGLFVTDLGRPEPGDTDDILSCALHMWTPGAGVPLANLETALSTARLVMLGTPTP